MTIRRLKTISTLAWLTAIAAAHVLPTPPDAPDHATPFSQGLVSVASAQQQPPTAPIIPLPEKQPAWVQGYAVRYMLRTTGIPDKSNAQSVIATIPAGGWLKPDASDIIVQTAQGQTIPAAVLSNDPQGDTIIQFARSGNDAFYWVYAGNPNAPADQTAKAPRFQEGLVYEIRQWEGDDVTSWSAVRSGLMKSENVIGNGLAAMILQNSNPARPGNPRSFAASYRGYLNIPKDGSYRIFANAQDSVFCFIDGMIADQKTGLGPHRSGRIVISSAGTLLDLKAGVHPIEVHHVMGTNPSSHGFCALMWVPPDAKNFAFVPTTQFVSSLHAQVISIAPASPTQNAATINLGIEDVLIAGQTELYLARLEAAGHIPDESKLQWDFGDGTKGTGRSVRHVYFNQGNYKITLTDGSGRVAVRNLHVWPVFGNTNPLTPKRVVETFEQSDWKAYDPVRLQQMYEFLINSEQPNRWPLLEAVSRHLISQPAQDLRIRTTQYGVLMRALAQQGKADDAAALYETALKEVGRISSLQVEMNLAAARVFDLNLRQPDRAVKIYQSIIDQHQRLRHPGVRDAAVALGDLYLRADDTQQAAQAYRLAQELNASAGESASGAATRGALLRTAEIQLRQGNVRESRRLLDRIAVDYPQQKLEGLYRFLRAESDRIAGRYEEALYSYEVLLKLDQWAGYHDRALFGIADTYQRMGDLSEADRWLQAIKTSFPEYYETQKLEEYRTNLATRRKRIENLGSLAKPFDTLTIHFDPDDKDDVARWGTFMQRSFNIVSAPGISHNGVVVVDNADLYRGYWDYRIPLKNISDENHYWVEIWYRTSHEPLRIIGDQHMHAFLTDDQNRGSDDGRQRNNLDVTMAGAWNRIGFLLRPTMIQDGVLSLSLRHVRGFYELDGLTITAITDRQYDAFQNFVDGTPQE